jgi:hypothetical protein
MRWLLPLLILAGFYPWIRAWLAVKKTSLAHALAWTCLAWLSWTVAEVARLQGPLPELLPIRYLALCLTACAGVAVLGARRPHVGAWNFVVAGLLAVLALPLLENLALGSRPIGPVRIGFLAATLLVVFGNYAATCLWPAALLAGLGCGGEMWLLLAGDDTPWAVTLGFPLAIGLVPWVGWVFWVLRRQPATELDRRWLDFRDRFGTLWSLRIREQFNHAAEHAGWPVILTWSGISPRKVDPSRNWDEGEILADFQALIKRFAVVE